ncbi:MAG: DUF1565 domain-containing protein, partial [Planctomycetes bacterium]|nr:DUF1565 domain-containing protein [Planctomycetota bacterium]
MRHLLPAALVVLALASAAGADDKVRPVRVEVVPNFHAASVYAFFEGDDNATATARLEYRAGGAADFRPGHTLARTGKGRLAASLFWLKPDEPLEVRVTFADPDGLADGAPAALAAATRTRSDRFPAATGKTYFVGPQGDDAAPGTREKPFKTVQHAVDLAEPGDVIRLLDGTYHEAVTVKRSGRPDAYITLRADADVAPPPAPGAAGGAEKPSPAAARLAGWVLAPDAWEKAGDDLL